MRRPGPAELGTWALAAGLLLLLSLPLLALLASSSTEGWRSSLSHPHFLAALWLSLQTSLSSLLLVALLGTPLAWVLASRSGRLSRSLELLVDLPIVLPPAVVGVGLLLALGRQGPLGGLWESLGWQLPFSTAAVVLAQIVVSAPFYVSTATATFRGLDPAQLGVARSLGARPSQLMRWVVLPLAWPGLLAGLALAWARSLGEFGATLILAGSLPGVTQTLPLAIYAALDQDLERAIALSLTLALGSLLALAILRRAAGRRPHG